MRTVAAILIICSTLHTVLGLKTEDPECMFTNDCYSLHQCKDIQDASCVCKFGQCVVIEDAKEKGSECTEYTDCPCSDDPENCFCKEGNCIAERWECHENQDCTKLEKCKGKDCTCTYDDLCEHDCNTDEDCFNGTFGCNDPSFPDYTCQCQSNLCQFAEVPLPCQNISDCVTNGACEGDKPCACTDSECGPPSHVTAEWFPYYSDRNCQTKEDCDLTIQSCQFGKCNCDDIIAVSEEENWGVCYATPEYQDYEPDQ